MMKSNKQWVFVNMALSVVMLLVLGMFTVFVDPYFHYHKPLSNLAYELDDQRYQNNGIVKHFEYDAIITGTSMTENFKTSEFDELFNVNSIKVPFSGASYKEVNDNLAIAIEKNPDIKIVVRCLDYNQLLSKADYMNYPEDSYPRYLYDDYLYNDVKYIFNKSILFGDTSRVLEYTRTGGMTTSFDEYSSWWKYYSYGEHVVKETYDRPDILKEKAITQEDYKNINENITQNVIDLAVQNPQIEFYLFFSPYSIYYWDSINREGTLLRQLEAEKYIIELLLPYDNIHLFSFFTEYDMICGLNNYKDIAHYGGHINSNILHWMYYGKYELTLENYETYCEEMKAFYMNYNYDSMFLTDCYISKEKYLLTDRFEPCSR